MHLPESASEGAKWFLLVGLAFFSADATSALIGRHLEVPDAPLPSALVGAIQENVPPQAAPPDLIKLLKTTEPRGGVSLDDEKSDEKAATAKADAAKLSSLSLTGTIAGANGKGLAIFDYQGSSRVVGSGETLEGYTIKAVTSHNVTLEGQGQTFILDIASSGGGGASASTLIPQQRVQVQPEPAATPEEQEPEETGPTGAILTTSELRNILDNPESFMGKGFMAKPEVREGEVVGMRVRLSNPSHPLARLGVQDGDLVKSLNDKPLQGPESISEVYRVLRNSQTLRFDVERNGQSETIEVQLDE